LCSHPSDFLWFLSVAVSPESRVDRNDFSIPIDNDDVTVLPPGCEDAAAGATGHNLPTRKSDVVSVRKKTEKGLGTHPEKGASKSSPGHGSKVTSSNSLLINPPAKDPSPSPGGGPEGKDPLQLRTLRSAPAKPKCLAPPISTQAQQQQQQLQQLLGRTRKQASLDDVPLLRDGRNKRQTKTFFLSSFKFV
jgi:hypothetical protein